MTAAAAGRSQQHDVGPRGGGHLGLGSGPPHGRRTADDPLNTVAQPRLLPEPLQLGVKFLRLAALERGGLAFLSGVLRIGAVLRIDQGDDAHDRLIGPSEGHKTRAAKEYLLVSEPGHVGRDLAAFQNGRRRAKPGGRLIESGKLAAGSIDALPAEQFFRVRPQPGSGGLVEVKDHERVIEHIERLRGPFQEIDEFGVEAMSGHGRIAMD